MMIPLKKVCECGCGLEVLEGRRFVYGHNLSLPEVRDYHSKRMMLYNFGRRGVHRTDTTKKNMSISAIEANKNPLFLKLKSDRAKEQWKDESFRRLMSEAVSRSNKRRLADPKEFEKMVNWLCRFKKRPTNLEKEFMEFSKQVGDDNWLYTGDGKVWIGRLNPDFVHKTQKRITEIFGSYYHKPEDERFKIRYYKHHGYDCIVIWDFELKEWIQGLGLSISV